jgi:TM2 domain-containing membrane protein YozV
MKRRPFVAMLLSILAPGLGQMYAGRNTRGAAILIGAIVIGNLNLILLQVFVATNTDSGPAWAYWVTRVGHDVLSLWSVVFWIWAVIDAYRPADGSHPDG